MNGTKISPPWWSFYHKIEALFGEDPEIKLNFDDSDMIIKMFVDNQAKADALSKVLPLEKDFGNVKVKIQIVPSDKVASTEQIFKAVFSGNPIFSDAVDVNVPGLPRASYVIFKPDVVQFYDDNLADAYGNITTLHQEIARDVFVENTGVYFCTDKID